MLPDALPSPHSDHTTVSGSPDRAILTDILQPAAGMLLPGPHYGGAIPAGARPAAASVELPKWFSDGAPSLPSLNSPTSAFSAVSSMPFADDDDTAGPKPHHISSPSAVTRSRPSTSPLQPARSAERQGPAPDALVVASMPDLGTLRRSASAAPYSNLMASGGAARGGGRDAAHAREAHAQSVLELWDLKRALERTARRDAASREADEQLQRGAERRRSRLRGTSRYVFPLQIGPGCAAIAYST